MQEDSVTRIIRKIAEDVFDQRIQPLDERVIQLEKSTKQIYEIDMAEAEQRVIAHLYGNITTSLKKAGQVWTKEEDFMLEQELKVAIAQIAQNHHRSRGAIKDRITQSFILGDF